MREFANCGRGLVRRLMLAAVATLALAAVPGKRAEALSPMTPGAMPAAKYASDGVIEVRGGHGGGGFHGGGHGGFRGGGIRGGALFHGRGVRVGPVFHGGGFRFARRHHFHRRFFHRPAYYYPAYYHPHRYCRIVWTYYGPRKICRHRPWWHRHHWRHHRHHRWHW